MIQSLIFNFNQKSANSAVSLSEGYVDLSVFNLSDFLSLS